MYIKVLIVVAYSAVFVFAKENGAACITPNRESALCIPIDSCKVIRQAITYLEATAIEFARNSQCGYDNGPLVCCGSIGRLITTPAPEIENTEKPEIKRKVTPISNPNLPDQKTCGIQMKKNRILGGEITNINEHPWMVVLKYVKKSDPSNFSFRCGGTLINQRYVLTAAQCLDIPGYDLIEARLGEWMISTEKDCEDEEKDESCADPVVDISIEKKIRYPYYSRKDGNNDIALLLLKEKVKYSEYINPICLPPHNLSAPLPGTEMEISGWGVTENGTQSDVKLKLKLIMKENEECILTMPPYVYISPNQACAGGEAGKDACNGDSGGPLMSKYYKEDNSQYEQWYQEGIIYKGLGCGQQGVPGLYTRLSRYINWILNNLEHP